MIKIKEIKKAIKNPSFMDEYNETKEAVKHARTTRRYNKIISNVLEKCIPLLEEKGIKKINFEFEGKKYDSTTKEILKDIEDMKKEGHV